MTDICDQDSIQYYENLFREQQNLARRIHVKSRNIEELMNHIASLKESLEEYRCQRAWLTNDQETKFKDQFDSSLEVQKLLEHSDISDVVQNLELKKTKLHEKGAKLMTELHF